MLNQISWGAVFGGKVMALVNQIILNMVCVGVGLATVDPLTGETSGVASLSVGAGIWLAILAIFAAAIGGYLFTRANKYGRARRRAEPFSNVWLNRLGYSIRK